MIYNMDVMQSKNYVKLTIGFGEPATNPEIVQFVEKNAPGVRFIAHDEPSIMGAPLLINGPASLPVAMTLAHKYAHVVPMVACFDPKLNGYVVSITHDPEYPLGTLVTEESLG